MKTKLCCSCQRDLPLSEFSFKNKEKGIRASECRKCHKEYNRRWYLENKQARIDYALERKQATVEWFSTYRKELECEVCGENHPACLDFHHLDPSEKENSISVMVYGGYSVDTILKEIEKCRVLCSNCHRKLHYEG